MPTASTGHTVHLVPGSSAELSATCKYSGNQWLRNTVQTGERRRAQKAVERQATTKSASASRKAITTATVAGGRPDLQFRWGLRSENHRGRRLVVVRRRPLPRGQQFQRPSRFGRSATWDLTLFVRYRCAAPMSLAEPQPSQRRACNTQHAAYDAVDAQARAGLIISTHRFDAQSTHRS